MKWQQRMTIMNDEEVQIKRKDGCRWWVAELLAADCEKAWLNPGEEETMQQWYAWLEKMEKEDKENG